MSQSAVLDVEKSNPQIPTSFDADSGSAIPISNTLDILGGDGITTSASGKTVTVTLDTPVSVALGGTGANSLTEDGVLLGQGANAVTAVTLNSGQLLIGDTGDAPVAASLTEGTGISIASAAGSITISSTATVAINFDADSGSATPALNTITIAGGTDLVTSASGSTLTVNIDAPIDVANGGTGATSLTDNAVLVGSGTGAVTALTVGTNGQVLVGSTGADPVFATLASSDSSITYAEGAGTLGITVTQATETQVGGGETATDAEAVAVSANDKLLVPSNMTSLFAEPPAIGGTTPAAGTFTSVVSSGVAGFDCTPSSDLDLDVLTVNVTGTPKLEWVESIDGFRITKGLVIGDTSGELSHTINGVSYSSDAEIHSIDSQDLGGLAIHRHTNTAAYGAHLIALRSNGTHASPTIVTDDDYIMRIVGAGYDGTDYAIGAEIRFEVDGTPASNDMPMRMVFLTSPDGSQTATEALRINEDQTLTLANDLAVTEGGTGLSATTAYAVLCGGTTSTGALQSIASVGTAGQILTSNGAGALPTFQAPTAATDVTDSTFRIQDDGDATKEIAFEASGITTSTVRTITMADQAIDLTPTTGTYQGADAGLTDIAGLAVTDGNVIVGDGANWVAESGATARTSLGVGTTDEPQFAKLGIATSVPHGGVGIGIMALEGGNQSTTGPHVQFTTDSDDYPLMQIFPWRHDAVEIHFDSYYDGVSNKSSDAGSNFRIRKKDDAFTVEGDSGIAQGSTVSYSVFHKVDSDGIVTIQYQPSFQAKNSSTDSNVTGDGTVYTCDFNSETFDRNGDFSADTFTAPVTGAYLLGTMLRVAGITSSHDIGTLIIVTSNRSYQQNFHPYNCADANGAYSPSLAMVADMDAADTSTITLTVANGTKVVDVQGGDSRTTFYGWLLG